MSVITVHDDEGTRIVVGCADIATSLYKLLKLSVPHNVSLEHGLPLPVRTDAEKAKAQSYVEEAHEG
jgi:hypothetical protein